MKKILLATDLGSNSDRALERALKIAKEHKAKLYIIHVVPPYTGSKSKEWALDLQKDTEDLIQGYLYDYKDSADVEVEIIVKQSREVYFEVLAAAYDHKVDLIVAGMHSKGKLRDLFVGTTIERVIRKGITPVLMVKEKPTGSYQSVMSAVDFAPGSRNALRIGMELSPKAVFSIEHVIVVPTVGIPTYGVGPYAHEYVRKSTENNAMKNMAAFLETERTHFAKHHNGEEKRLSGEIGDGQMTEMLIEKAKNLKTDLITIGTHSQPGFMSKLGRTAGDILSNPPCDVLIASEKVHT